MAVTESYQEEELTMHTTTRLLLLCSFAAIAIVSAPLAAQASGWGSGGQNASADDLIPSMSSGQAYSERYSFSVSLDGGGHIGMNWTISNLGIRNGYGAAQVRFEHSDFDNYSSSERESRRNWSYDENSFKLDIADATIRAVDDSTFELNYDAGDVKAELTFENTIDMWRPGSGELGDGGDFYRFTMVSPRANVTGRIYRDGQWHDVSGTNSGYADHVVTNVAPYNLASRFTRFRQYDDDVFVMWREVDLTDDYGGDNPVWVVVGVGDEIVYEDLDAELRFGDVERDDETGYRVPHAVQVLSENADGNLRLTLRKDNINRTDLLEEHGRVARMIASSVSNPFQYNVEGDYALEVNVGDRRLRTMDDGHVTIDYVTD